MIAEDFEYQYAYQSAHSSTDSGKSLLLAHCSEIKEENQIPCFFYGNIKDSFVAAKCLSALAKTVRSHFALAPGARAFLRDPIVSVGDNKIRFEAFSSCNGVYSRVEINAGAIDGEFLASGCTNVDFNNETVKAFNQVNRSEKLILGVGQQELKITTERGTVTEKKVSLPNRWIKGLANVQMYLSKMEFVFELNKIKAIQLFRLLPKATVKGDYYLVKERNKTYFSPSYKAGAISIGGAHRLALLNPLLPFCDKIDVYSDPDKQCIAFQLHLKNISKLFVFSAGTYRGFSGEGQTLENMTLEIPDDYIVAINQLCKANQSFQPTLLAIESDVDFKLMDNLQASLSSIGLLGFDLLSQEHFYRRLPFKLNRLKSLNPRFKNAKKLIDQDEVRIISQEKKSTVAEVKGSGGVFHKVILDAKGNRCTCHWYTKNKNKRGLCKHVLALKMKLEQG